MPMSTEKTITCRCKSCNQSLNIPLITSTNQKAQSGDLFMCSFCGLVSKFDTDMNIEIASLDDIALLKNKDQLAWDLMRQDAYNVAKRALLN